MSPLSGGGRDWPLPPLFFVRADRCVGERGKGGLLMRAASLICGWRMGIDRGNEVGLGRGVKAGLGYGGYVCVLSII